MNTDIVTSHDASHNVITHKDLQDCKRSTSSRASELDSIFLSQNIDRKGTAPRGKPRSRQAPLLPFDKQIARTARRDHSGSQGRLTGQPTKGIRCGMRDMPSHQISMAVGDDGKSNNRQFLYRQRFGKVHQCQSKTNIVRLAFCGNCSRSQMTRKGGEAIEDVRVSGLSEIEVTCAEKFNGAKLRADATAKVGSATARLEPRTKCWQDDMHT